MPISVKICGISEPEHAQTAAAAGANFLGFIFFAPSPRNLTLDAAKALGPTLPHGPKRVGVFVDAEHSLIEAAVAALRLDIIQLHGKETPEDTETIKKIPAFP